MGNFTIDGLDDETESHVVPTVAAWRPASKFKMAALLGPELEFYVQLNPRVIHVWGLHLAQGGPCWGWLDGGKWPQWNKDEVVVSPSLLASFFQAR